MIKLISTVFLFYTLSFSTSAQASPESTLKGSLAQIDAVQEALTDLASEEYATNPWPNYFVMGIASSQKYYAFSNGDLMEVTILNLTTEPSALTELKPETRYFKIEVDCTSVDDCGFKADHYEGELSPMTTF